MRHEAVMKHQAERTCVGCRNVFQKNEVIRIVAGSERIVIDYREKMQGRAVYVCPKRACITKALAKEALSKALRQKVTVPSVDEFIGSLSAAIEEKIRSLIIMSAKAGKIASGYSAVRDALEKKRVELLVFARDLSEGTAEKISHAEVVTIRHATMFTREEMGGFLNRELVGVVGILDTGLAEALWREVGRLKDLINNNE